MAFFDINLTPNENYLLGAYHTQHAKGSTLDTMPALLGDNPQINKRTFLQVRKSLAEKGKVILHDGVRHQTTATFSLPQQG